MIHQATIAALLTLSCMIAPRFIISGENSSPTNYHSSASTRKSPDDFNGSMFKYKSLLFSTDDSKKQLKKDISMLKACINMMKDNSDPKTLGYVLNNFAGLPEALNQVGKGQRRNLLKKLHNDKILDGSNNSIKN